MRGWHDTALTWEKEFAGKPFYTDVTDELLTNWLPVNTHSQKNPLNARDSSTTENPVESGYPYGIVYELAVLLLSPGLHILISAQNFCRL